VLTLPASGATTAPADTVAYAAATLLALAREEHAGRRDKRLLEPNQATWNLFRGRLGHRAFLELLLEDAAVRQPFPFDVVRALGKENALADLPDATVTAWIEELGRIDLGAPGADYMAAQAKTLGVLTRGAKADLHKVKPFHKVLELPGSGGQLAHHMASSQPELVFRDVFTIACANRAEWVLAGLAAVERRAEGADLSIKLETSLDAFRSQPFDYFVGLAPEKGGLFTKAEIAAVAPPDATIVLV
jgi:hypothetical protein